MTLNAGAEIGEWTIVRFLGSGRSGTVYEVRNDRANTRHAALKIHCGVGVKATEVDFCREADFVENNRLPGVVPGFLGRGRTDDTPFFVMEFAEPLPSRLPRRTIRKHFAEVAEALSVLHATGHLHCDIKPTNIGLIDERALLLDFGSVRSIAAARESPERIGTWKYMAPEVREASILDIRADIYSLGITLGECCNRAARRTFESLVLHATNNDPDERPQTAADFRCELKDCKDRLAKVGRIAAWGVAAVLGGLMLLTGINTALYFYRRTATERKYGKWIDANVHLRSGLIFLERGDRANAVRYLRQAENNGSAEATSRLKEIDVGD